jgi:hypothetical protein
MVSSRSFPTCALVVALSTSLLAGDELPFRADHPWLIPATAVRAAPQLRLIQDDAEVTGGVFDWPGDATPRGDQPGKPEPLASNRPDITEPGPDSADFPDSAFAVPTGIVYLETSLTYASSKGPRVRDYFTNTLVRIGLWEDLELRIASPGIIHENGPEESVTGVGPLTIGFKQHVWDEVAESGIPAFGVIAQVNVPTASAGFDDGTAIPTVFCNFDHTLSANSYFEWNLGLSAVHADDGHRFVQGNFLWSLGHEVNDDITVFFHGFTNFPASSGNQEEVVMGPGMIWFVNKRVAVDFSYNFGLTDESLHRLVRLGLSMAF